MYGPPPAAVGARPPRTGGTGVPRRRVGTPADLRAALPDAGDFAFAVEGGPSSFNCLALCTASTSFFFSLMAL